MKSNIKLFLILMAPALLIESCSAPVNRESAAVKRYKEMNYRFEQDNEFITEFITTQVTGFDFRDGLARRDPSSVIKVGDTYYVWYTRSEGSPLVDFEMANDSLRFVNYDLADIGYATSKDGFHWEEQGVAAKRGPKGSFDHRTVFTPDILVAGEKYYLYYQAAGELSQGLGWDFGYNDIGMSWADSPDGPWHRHPEPVLDTGPEGSFDELNIHDPTLIFKGGKYYMYYKGQPRSPDMNYYLEGRDARYATRIAWGLAVADNPVGPWVKSEYNPVLCGGHECIVFPYRDGIGAIVPQGPERRSIQFSRDMVNFYPVAHGNKNLPYAAGVYRPGNFTDIETVSGQGITWGMRNDHVKGVSGAWKTISRFDCNLTPPEDDRRRNLVFQNVLRNEPRQEVKLSASTERFISNGILYEQDNEFWTTFQTGKNNVIGNDDGIDRQDPSGVIRAGETYFVWYCRTANSPGGSTDGMADIWYATSADGQGWTEQGAAVRGTGGSFDQPAVCSPDILYADDRYYLYYETGSKYIGMSWAESPDGPWHDSPEPVLQPGNEGAFDEQSVSDPTFVVKGGKYYMYYRGLPDGKRAKYGLRAGWGVAIADKPAGPFVRSALNPVIVGDGACIVFPYRDGICALIPEGPERGSTQYSEDGVNFYPMAFGVRENLYGRGDEFPYSAGVFRPGNFRDIEDAKGQGVTWGLRNQSRIINGKKQHYLVRFDCDMSIERGDSLRRDTEEWYRTEYNGKVKHIIP